MDREAWIDQDDAWITDTIRRCGWAVHYIGGDTCSRPGCGCPPGDGPPFAYTTGLHGLGHPELLIVGLDPTSAVTILNTLGRRIRDGEQLIPGMLVTFEDWPHRIVPETVPNPEEILFEANRFYGRPPGYPVSALQLTYDVRRGRFPWDVGYAAPDLQPGPGTFTA